MPTNPSLNVRRALLGAVLQSDPRTKASVTAALANTWVYDLKCEPAGIFDGSENRPHGNHGGAAKREKVKQKGIVQFKTRMRHADATLLLLQGCGCVLSGTDSEIATATWADFTARKYLTFKVWEAGRIKEVYAANGTVKIAPMGGAGSPVIAEWSFDGIWFDGPSDGAMVSDPTITTASYRAAGMTLDVDSGSIPQVDSWEVDLGAEVAERADVTDETGLDCFQVEDGSPMLKLDPEARLVAHYDAYGLLVDGEVVPVELVLTDGTNTATIDLPACQRLAVTDGARDKKRLDEVEFECQKDSSGVDFKFTESVPA
jgi:hypothetical protein